MERAPSKNPWLLPALVSGQGLIILTLLGMILGVLPNLVTKEDLKDGFPWPKEKDYVLAQIVHNKDLIKENSQTLKHINTQLQEMQARLARMEGIYEQVVRP